MADYFETYGRNIIKDENPVYYMDGNRIKSYDTGETVFEMYGNRIYGDGGGAGEGFKFEPEFIGSITTTTVGTSEYKVFENLFDYDFIVITNEEMDNFASVSFFRPISYIIPTPEPISKSFDELHCVSKTLSGNFYDDGKIRVDIHPDGTVYYYRSSHTPTTIYIYGVHKKGIVPEPKGIKAYVYTNGIKVDNDYQPYDIATFLFDKADFINIENNHDVVISKKGTYKILFFVENVGGVSANNTTISINMEIDGIPFYTQEMRSYNATGPNEFNVILTCAEEIRINVFNNVQGWCTVASMLIIEV